MDWDWLKLVSEPYYVQAALVVSLLNVWLLVGFFCYLNQVAPHPSQSQVEIPVFLLLGLASLYAAGGQSSSSHPGVGPTAAPTDLNQRRMIPL